MATDFKTSLTGAYGIAYWKGFLFIGSYTDATITKINFTNGLNPVPNDATSADFISLDSAYALGQMKVYDDYLYCALIHETTAANGKIIRINLNNSPATSVDYITGLNNPNGFVKLENEFYITLSSSIIRVTPNSNNPSLGKTTFSDLSDYLDTPHGIDTDGSNIYFCNYGTTNKNIYKFNINDTSTITTVVSLSSGSGRHDNLCLNGKYLYVCARTDQKILRFKVKESTLPITNSIANRFEIFENTNENPCMMLFVNNKMFISFYNANKVVTRNLNTDFQSNSSFTMTHSTGTITYTLNAHYTINSSWEEVGLQSGKVIIDGNSKKITIANTMGTNTLFFGGSTGINNVLEINNLTIESNANIISGLIRAYGFVKITNCKFILNGNIANNGGGLAYNNFGRETYDGINISISESSAIVKGKIGENSGPLLGYFATGCIASISKCYTMVLDNNPSNLSDDSILRTLGSGAGAFVGSGVGQNGGTAPGTLSSPGTIVDEQNFAIGVTISESFCILSGSMAYGSGIIGGKFLGTGSLISIGKFYAMTNISEYTQTVGQPSNSQQPYVISSFTGSGSLPTFNVANINILHLGINGSGFKIYDGVQTLTGLTTHTTTKNFQTSANSLNATVGNNIYYFNIAPKPVSGPTGFKCFSPITMQIDNNPNNIQNVLINTTTNEYAFRNQIREITFNTITTKTVGDSNFTLSGTVNPSATINYSSLNNLVKITGSTVQILNSGTGEIKAWVDWDSTYSYSEQTNTFTIDSETLTDATAYATLGNRYLTNASEIETVSGVSGQVVTLDVNTQSAFYEGASIPAKVHVNKTGSIANISGITGYAIKAQANSVTVFHEITNTTVVAKVAGLSAAALTTESAVSAASAILLKIFKIESTDSIDIEANAPTAGKQIKIVHINPKLNAGAGQVDSIMSLSARAGGKVGKTISSFSIFAIYELNIQSSSSGITVKTGGDPFIKPLIGETFALAPHIKFVNLLADYKNNLFINAQVDLLEKTDFPEQIYWDSSFSKTESTSHIYSNSYYRNFLIKYQEETIQIDADTLNFNSSTNKIKIISVKPKTGIHSISFNKTYPLTNQTKQVKIALGNYLLTITSDINTDDRHYLELLNVKQFDLPFVSGALIDKSNIIRISNLDGLELELVNPTQLNQSNH
jgi:hypothetical protein